MTMPTVRPPGPHPILTRLVAALVAQATLALLAMSTSPSSVASAQSQAQDRSVRVLSFNIRHGQGIDGVVDLERVAATVEASGAGIVGLQEVDRHWGERSDFVDQASALADRLGMHVVYGANLDLDPLLPGGARRQYGTAILSDHPIQAWRNVLLPRTGTREQRGLLEARINVRGVRVLVYNTHLQHDSQPERLAQIDAIRGIIGTPTESVVLVGDLNAGPDTPEIAAITESLRDAWVEAGVGDGFTHSADDPTARIDYVVASDDVVVRTAAVVARDASDHLPVSADLPLSGGRVGKRPSPK